MHCSRRFMVQTLVFSLSYLHGQVSPPETLVVKVGSTWARNGRWILPENAGLPRNIQGSFTCRKSTTWDRQLYFPSEERRAEDFLALKNPKISVGFEPTKLGSKGQHATSRPPKPLTEALTQKYLFTSFRICRFLVPHQMYWDLQNFRIRCFLESPYNRLEVRTVRVRIHQISHLSVYLMT